MVLLQVPHFVYCDEIEVDRLVALRKTMQPTFVDAGTRLTYMPFILKAASLALSEFPILNSQVCFHSGSSTARKGRLSCSKAVPFVQAHRTLCRDTPSSEVFLVVVTGSAASSPARTARRLFIPCSYCPPPLHPLLVLPAASSRLLVGGVIALLLLFCPGLLLPLRRNEYAPMQLSACEGFINYKGDHNLSIAMDSPMGLTCRRRDCHFADVPSPCLLKHLLNGEWGCSRMTASPTARPDRPEHQAGPVQVPTRDLGRE